MEILIIKLVKSYVKFELKVLIHRLLKLKQKPKNIRKNQI